LMGRWCGVKEGNHLSIQQLSVGERGGGTNTRRLMRRSGKN
jgi:hypothetical protein